MVSSDNVAIFWDFENCRPPTSSSGYFIADKIRRIARPFGSIMLFKAYLELSSEFLSAKSYTLQSELQSSGISLTHCPHNGRKDVADKMMIVDMLTFAIDNRVPATIIIITGDRDFSYAASILRLRGYEVIVVLPSTSSHVSLRMQASILFEWQRDVLGNRSSCPPTNEDTSGQQECSSSAVSSEMTMVSPSNVIAAGNNIPDPFAPATPTTLLPGQSSPTALQPLSSDTDENTIDITSNTTPLDPLFAGGSPLEANFRNTCEYCGKRTRTSEVRKYCFDEFGQDKKFNVDDSQIRARRQFLDPIQQYGSAMQPLQVPFGQHASSCTLVDEHPSNNMRVETESQIPARIVDVIAKETEGDERIRVSEKTTQVEGESQREGDGALGRRPSLPGAPPLPLSSPRSATLTDTTGFNTTGDLTGMGSLDVLLRETHSDAVIAVLPASRDKEFNNPRSCPTPHADSHDDDTSSGEFSGRSSGAPQPSLSLPRPSSSRSQGEASTAVDQPNGLGRDASLIQAAPTSTCGSVSQTTLVPLAAVHPQSSPPTFPASLQASKPVKTDQQVDGRFSVLIDCFRTKMARGETARIRASDLGVMLLKREPRVYESAGVHRLKDYVNLACSKGIVMYTSLNNGDSWVMLNPCFSSSNAQVKIALTHSITNAPESTPSSLPSPPIIQESASVPPNANASNVPEPFIPLVFLLRQLSPSSGRVLFSSLGLAISQKYPGLYKRAGVFNLRAYLERARSYGIVALGALEMQGKQWVQLVGAHQIE
ncbi:hypothetical protein SCHPADRAFT_899591 [Schizopora paradoxa]|uniref:NYN domain-containing protein n=1 Tax=Schizopora paradoxa TaxID=27342 RepID=A0A0H2SNC9_9AGAM|nr:hypothetical protein SCHPADRAFT_899591 [Schizopora paradoxa]